MNAGMLSSRYSCQQVFASRKEMLVLFRFVPTDMPQAPTPSLEGIDLLLQGWDGLADGWRLLDMIIVLLLSLFLGALIAYHPSSRKRVSSLEHYEQPQTILLYALVAAVVAIIVKTQPNMAFVIFGIGGLLRFRTMVGEAKDTGRVILVTVVGLSCGLKIFTVALPVTLLGWIMIWVLEKNTAGIIRVSGADELHLQAATRAYREAIEKSGCIVIGEQTKLVKRQFLFVVKIPKDFDKPGLRSRFEALPAEVRGVVDWERI